MDFIYFFHPKQVIQKKEFFQTINDIYSIDVTNDLEQIEEEEYQSKMKEVQKVEDFRREREFYGKFYLISSELFIY